MLEHPRHTRAVLIVFGVAVTAPVVTANLPNAAATLGDAVGARTGRRLEVSQPPCETSNCATHDSLNARQCHVFSTQKPIYVGSSPGNAFALLV